MTDEEALQKIRDLVNKRMAYALANDEDTWIHTRGDLLLIFLQLQILKKLESIDGTLILIMNEIEVSHEPPHTR